MPSYSLYIQQVSTKSNKNAFTISPVIRFLLETDIKCLYFMMSAVSALL